MMRATRCLALVLVLALALALPAVPALASENPVCQSTGKDDKVGRSPLSRGEIAAWIAENRIQGLSPDHWAAGPIMELATSGAMNVVAGENLSPDTPIALWQAAGSLLAWANQPIDRLTPQEMVEQAVARQMIPGSAQAPEHLVTRVEAAYMVARLTQVPAVVKQETNMAQVFADWPAVPAESRDLVYWVTIRNRLFVGLPDHTFRPAETFTLGQFAMVMHRLRSYWSQGPVPELLGP